jgi:hypothetical protein
LKGDPDKLASAKNKTGGEVTANLLYKVMFESCLEDEGSQKVQNLPLAGFEK